MKEERYRKTLQTLQSKNQLRVLRDMTQQRGVEVSFNKKPYINMSSNDYLGLAFDDELLEDFYAQLIPETRVTQFGMGAASSRLLTGNTGIYSLLEEKIAAMYNKQAALVFNSGYHANIGILPALTSKNDLILSDKFNHASIIDGIRLCDATCLRYKHLDYDQLEAILEKRRSEFDQVFIVTESIFSMDGDIADLQKLVEIKNKYSAALYVDEAHAFGTRGETGLGICQEHGVVDDIEYIVGTFGKAIASQGAYICCSQLVKNYLINTMRSLIFTTGLPPVTLWWLHFIIDKITHYKQKREKLAQISQYTKSALSTLGFASDSESNIMPIVLGENKDAEMAAELMQKHGFLIFPVRPPTVPVGTARLRLSLSAAMNEAMLEPMIQVLKIMKK